MKIKEFLDKLEMLEFDISNFNASKFYRDNKDEDMSIGVYVRISKKNSNLIEQQKKAIMMFLQRKIRIDSNTEVRHYYDDGFSGTREGREGYCNMMRDLKLRKINTIITTNIDRFGRSTENILTDIYPNGEVTYLYISLDNKVINAISNIDYIREKANIANDYAKTCSVKARRGLETRINEGSAISSKAAYGYVIDLDNITGMRRYRLGKDEEVETVKYIYEKYILGETLGDISRNLISRGVPSPTGKKLWNKSTIESILKNPLYSGQLYQRRYQKQGYTYYGDGKKVIKVGKDDWVNCGIFKGIIDIQSYNTVQSMLSENRNVRSTKSNKKIFTGVLKCGECGRALIYKEKWQGYKCSGSQHKEGKCTTHFVKENEMWDLIYNKLNEKINANYEGLKESVVEKINEDNKVQQKLKKIEKNNQKIDNATKKIISLCLEEDSEDTREIISGIKNEILKLKKENDDLNKTIEENKIYKNNMLEILNNINDHIIKENWVIRLFIKEIKVYQYNRIDIIWRC